jgi:hypothetical protein
MTIVSLRVAEQPDDSTTAILLTVEVRPFAAQFVSHLSCTPELTDVACTVLILNTALAVRSVTDGLHTAVSIPNVSS